MSSKETPKKVSSAFLATLVGLAFVLTLFMLNKYLILIVLALLFADLFQPLYEKFLSWTGKKTLVSLGLVIVCFLLVVVIPVTIAVLLFAYEINQLVEFVNNWNNKTDVTISQVIDQVNRLLERVPYVDVSISVGQVISFIQKNIKELGNILATNIIKAGSSVLSLIAQISTFAITFGATVVYLDDVKEYLVKLSPLKEKLTSKMIKSILGTGKSMLKSIFIVSAIQGALSGIILAILGVPFPIFWGMIALILSIIPVGAGFILFPIALVLMLSGSIVKGIILVAASALVVGLADNIIRPLLASSTSKLHPILIFLGMIGGVVTFGFWGLVFGPMIVAFLKVSLEAFLQLENENS